LLQHAWACVHAHQMGFAVQSPPQSQEFAGGRPSHTTGPRTGTGTEGKSLGPTLGTPEGKPGEVGLGLTLGTPRSTLDGTPEGKSLGPTLGMPEGKPEGESLRSGETPDGNLEGYSLGPTLGMPEGRPEGESLNPGVTGTPEGDSLGPVL